MVPLGMIFTNIRYNDTFMENTIQIVDNKVVEVVYDNIEINSELIVIDIMNIENRIEQLQKELEDKRDKQKVQ